MNKKFEKTEFKITSTCNKSLALGATLALAVVLSSQDARAITVNWADTATDFNIGSSWTGGTAPGTADIGAFLGTLAFNPNLTADKTILGITFNAGGNTLSSTGGFSLGVTNSTGISATNTTGTNIISANIVLSRPAAGAVTFSQALGGTLQYTGVISQLGTSTGPLLLGGAGTHILSGNNTFTGGVSLSTSNGKLIINNAGALGTGALSATANNVSIDNTSGGALTLANALNANNNVNGTTTTNNLTHTGTNNLTFNGVTTFSAQPVRAISVGGSGVLTLAGGVNESIASSLIKNGTGTLALEGAINYSGTTNVNGGTLLINGIAASTGAVSVGASGTLGGSGTIGGATTAAANSTLTPGGNGVAGNLTFDSTLNISGLTGGAGTNRLVFDLGASSDKITLTDDILTMGTLDFNDFNFNLIAGFSAGTYLLFDTTQTISGALGTATGTIGGLAATLSFTGGLGNDQDLILTVVPEPSTYALLAGGLGLLAFLRLRPRKNI